MLIWLVMRRARPQGDRPSRHARLYARKSSAGARDRRPLSDLPPVVRRLVRVQGLGAAPAPARNARAGAAGRSALLVAATGAGKTLAGFLPTICELAEQPSEGLHTLYVSPLKALAVDVQRNLIGPIEEMGLPIRVETRTGDTPSDRKARQRVKPPQILLTTPESLSLLLSYPDSCAMFDGLRTIVVDEVHAFATGKRGDLLSLSHGAAADARARPAPGRPVGDGRDPDAYRAWLAPDGDMDLVDLVVGDPGAEPDLSILMPEDTIPWGGPFGPLRDADR